MLLDAFVMSYVTCFAINWKPPANVPKTGFYSGQKED